MFLCPSDLSSPPDCCKLQPLQRDPGIPGHIQARQETCGWVGGHGRLPTPALSFQGEEGHPLQFFSPPSTHILSAVICNKCRRSENLQSCRASPGKKLDFTNPSKRALPLLSAQQASTYLCQTSEVCFCRTTTAKQLHFPGCRFAIISFSQPQRSQARDQTFSPGRSTGPGRSSNTAVCPAGAAPCRKKAGNLWTVKVPSDRVTRPQGGA